MADGGIVMVAPSQPHSIVTSAHAHVPRLEVGTHPVECLLHLCARRTLDAADKAELAAVGTTLDATAWREVGVRARAEGLEGVVLTHTSAAGLLDRMPPDVTSALLDAYRSAWIGNRRLRGMLAEVLAAFAARGVEALAVKGVALAQRYYGEPALRPAGDLDLLVRRADVATCHAALEALGCRSYPGTGHLRDFYPLIFRALAYQHPSGLSIELHWELVSLPAYLPRLRADAGLWARAERIEVLGRQARYLAPADELRYLAMHAVVQHADQSRLIWLVDIAELVRNLPATWDWESFVSETVRRGLARPVALALLAVRKLGPLPVPQESIEHLVKAAETPSERRAWRQSLGREAGVRLPGAALRMLYYQDSFADRAVLLGHLIGRARRRWLRRAGEPARRSNTGDPIQPTCAETSRAGTLTDEPADSA